jgi:hypothetical protein
MAASNTCSKLIPDWRFESNAFTASSFFMNALPAMNLISCL